MQFKVDENLPAEVANLLFAAGYRSDTVVDENLSGETDSVIASVCKKEHRALVTLDTDFGDIRTFVPEQFYGIILLRLKSQDKNSVLKILHRLIPVLSRETLEKRLWIVEEDRIRIRD